jgi:hypothetical protein
MRVNWARLLVVLVLALVACGVLGALLASGLSLKRIATSLGVPAATEVVTRAPTAAVAGPTAVRVATEESRSEAAAPGDRTDLPPFRVLTLQYTPYMATLALMDAMGTMEDLGFDLQLVDVYADDVNLDEAGQCEAIRTGDYDALATTLDATRKCGPEALVGIPIGQSAGNDAIVVKQGVETWNDVFAHAVAFTGYSVSEYMACFASHTADAPLVQPERYDDAAEAVDAWSSTGAEQNIPSVVAWEPEVSRALTLVPGSRVILSSRDVRILWDVVEFSKDLVDSEPDRYQAFSHAYYQALLELSRDPQGALERIVTWAGADEGRLALVTTSDPVQFTTDLGNEAFATLRDAGILMEDRQTLRNRLDEAAFYWQYCNVDVPPVTDLDTLIAPQFVLESRKDTSLVADENVRPSPEVFQVTDFTNRAAVTDTDIEAARVLFRTGVDIEFLPNRTDFRDPAAAATVLGNAVRFLRTCQECVLEVQGGAAYPGERVCPGCRPEDSDALAIERGRKVYDELRQRFDVPEAQLRFVEQAHPPQFPGSNDEDELRQDRRTFLTGYQLSGR